MARSYQEPAQLWTGKKLPGRCQTWGPPRFGVKEKSRRGRRTTPTKMHHCSLPQHIYHWPAVAMKFSRSALNELRRPSVVTLTAPALMVSSSLASKAVAWALGLQNTWGGGAGRGVGSNVCGGG